MTNADSCLSAEEKRRLRTVRRRLQATEASGRVLWSEQELNRLHFTMWLIANGRLNAPLVEGTGNERLQESAASLSC